MVSVKSVTSAKSVPDTAVPLPTETVTAVSVLSATPPSRAPVTITSTASDAFSATDAGNTRERHLGRRRVVVGDGAGRAGRLGQAHPGGQGPARRQRSRVTVKVSSPSTSTSSVVLTETVVLVWPAVTVALPAVTAV